MLSRWNSPRLCRSNAKAAFVQKRAVLNIALDKEIIVTNTAFAERAWRQLIDFKRGAVSAKSCEYCSNQENRRTPPFATDLPGLFRHRGDVQPGHQPALSGRPAIHAAGL